MSRLVAIVRMRLAARLGPREAPVNAADPRRSRPVGVHAHEEAVRVAGQLKRASGAKKRGAPRWDPALRRWRACAQPTAPRANELGLLP
jgi:hypothetical protein